MSLLTNLYVPSDVSVPSSSTSPAPIPYSSRRLTVKPAFGPLAQNIESFPEFVPVPRQAPLIPASTEALPPLGDDDHSQQIDAQSQSSIEAPVDSTSRASSSETHIKLRQRAPFTSPFTDCLGTFGKYNVTHFSRPNDGQVNGYVKFKWPAQKIQSAEFQLQISGRIYAELSEDQVHIPDMVHGMSRAHQKRSFGPTASDVIESPDWSSPTSASAPASSPGYSSSFRTGPSPGVSLSGVLPPTYQDQAMQRDRPRMIPSGFGLDAAMDPMGRKLWDFYVKNWCPGRAVLQETNLWLHDFARMQKSPGVLGAIQSLAGIYIYDYLRMPKVLNSVNERFAVAETALAQLLKNPSDIVVGKGSEVITILVMLSMQDIVLTERRLKKPHTPRWLQGFRHSEYFLDVSDTGSRFWNNVNIQQDSLVMSQSILVGRAVILAQPMMPLTDPASFDPEKEIQRFGWLLYGSPEELYEIQGGCGFSKKLMHVVSQITYCAARLQQDPESVMIPMTADYLMKELQQMRQWSSASERWEEEKKRPRTIEVVESRSPDHIVSGKPEMIHVTAEAWRFAAIIYLQCRVLRLPRDDPAVVENLQHLSNCIRIMPTSGMIFTAQAPLFPVFLLGMLATIPEHKNTSQFWFEQVVNTPVRSSVPPLYNALQRIWTWIDNEIELSVPGSLPGNIGNRPRWWEQLVAEVEKREKETLKQRPKEKRRIEKLSWPYGTELADIISKVAECNSRCSSVVRGANYGSDCTMAPKASTEGAAITAYAGCGQGRTGLVGMEDGGSYLLYGTSFSHARVIAVVSFKGVASTKTESRILSRMSATSNLLNRHMYDGCPDDDWGIICGDSIDCAVHFYTRQMELDAELL